MMGSGQRYSTAPFMIVWKSKTQTQIQIEAVKNQADLFLEPLLFDIDSTRSLGLGVPAHETDDHARAVTRSSVG